MVSNLSGAEILRLVRLDRRSHRGVVGGLGGYTTTVYKTITADLAEACIKFRKSTVFYSRAAENYEQERHGSSTGQYCFLRDPRMNNTIITFLLCSGFLPSTYSQVNALQGVCKRVSTLVQRGQVELNLTGYVLRKGHRMDKKHNQDQNDERMIVSTSIRGGQGHALSAYTTLRTLRLDYCDVNLTVEEHGIEGNEDEEKEKEKKEREYKQHVAKRQRSVGTEDDRNASTSGTYGSADPASV